MSDSDTTDSDSGIRFKTTSTRFRLGGTDKYPATSEPSHSADSNNGHRRNRRSERDHRRSDDHRTSRHSKRSSSRSKSRSRERRKQKEKDRKRRRSRSRSKSKRPQTKQEQDSSSTSANQAKSTTIENNDTSSVAKQSKILDISVSSLSSQEDHIGKDEISEDIFGPALPPALQSQVNESTVNNSPHREEKTDTIGPALPPHLIEKKPDDEHNLTTNNTHIIGPTLPGGFKLTTVTNDSSESELSPFSEEEPNEEEDFIGPVLGASSSRAHVELEQRALELKIKRFDGENYNSKNTNDLSREDWMLELPDIRKVSDMGLGARQFRTREKQPIGDRSVWTDTPSERARKTSGHSSKDPQYDHEVEQERRRAAERDKQQDELVKRHKKKHKRDKSMLEIHQTKVKKDKESSSLEPTRRPFDRNIDLHANRFDDAQKKAIYKKAQLLDTRFSSGASKFL